MRRFLILFTVMTAAILPASSQNPAPDSQTLRDILTEIRHLARTCTPRQQPLRESRGDSSLLSPDAR